MDKYNACSRKRTGKSYAFSLCNIFLSLTRKYYFWGNLLHHEKVIPHDARLHGIERQKFTRPD